MLENPPADRPAAVSGLKPVVAPTEVTLMMGSKREILGFGEPAERVDAQGASTRECGNECVTRIVQPRTGDSAVPGSIEDGGSASSELRILIAEQTVEVVGANEGTAMKVLGTYLPMAVVIPGSLKP